MAQNPPRRIIAPETAARGKPVQIRTLIQHPMTTGHGSDSGGRPVPRRIIHKLTVSLNGAEIFSADLFPGTAANPYLSFWTVPDASGELVFTWFDDSGDQYVERRRITVD